MRRLVSELDRLGASIERGSLPAVQTNFHEILSSAVERRGKVSIYVALNLKHLLMRSSCVAFTSSQLPPQEWQRRGPDDESKYEERPYNKVAPVRSALACCWKWNDKTGIRDLYTKAPHSEKRVQIKFTRFAAQEAPAIPELQPPSSRVLSADDSSGPHDSSLQGLGRVHLITLHNAVFYRLGEGDDSLRVRQKRSPLSRNMDLLKEPVEEHDPEGEVECLRSFSSSILCGEKSEPIAAAIVAILGSTSKSGTLRLLAIAGSVTLTDICCAADVALAHSMANGNFELSIHLIDKLQVPLTLEHLKICRKVGITLRYLSAIKTIADHVSSLSILLQVGWMPPRRLAEHIKLGLPFKASFEAKENEVDPALRHGALRWTS